MAENTIIHPESPDELPNVSTEFIKDNQRLSFQSQNKNGGPYNKKDRELRRNEVYRLHFEYGYSAKKISELMKINRNTINGDVQYWYVHIAKNWKSFDPLYWILKNIQRLEIQKTRLREQLDKTKEFQQRLAIERLILEIESRISQTQLKICYSGQKVHKLATNWLNKWMKENKKTDRYITYGDIQSVSGKSYEKIKKILKER